MSRFNDHGFSERDIHFISEFFGELSSQVMYSPHSSDYHELHSLLYRKFKNILQRETRNWNDFFAVFKMPPPGGIRQRCLTNLNHYWANYIIIALAIFTLRILFAPFLLVSLIILIAFNGYLIAYISEVQITSDITLVGWSKTAAAAAVSFVFLGLTRGLEHILWNLLLTVILCGAHMVLRPRSVTASNDSAVELKLHGLSWLDGSREAERDAEAPPVVSEEELFLNGYSGSSSASVRKRH